MDVAFFHHYSLTHGGGGEGFVVELANFLARKGHTVEVHALPFRRRKATLLLDDSVAYCERWVHRSRSEVAYEVYAPGVTGLFRQRGPRIAGLHGAVVMDFESPARFYLRQGPYVAGAYLVRRSRGPRYLADFDAVHAVSPVPLSHRHLYVLPNWVDCTKSAEALELKARRAETFTVLYVGKPSYTKGFDLFAAVSERVPHEDIRFVAIGPPDRKFGGGGRVEWVGYVPHEEMWKAYARASVLLHPTRQESSGRAILESLAAGTPVITTPIPCHRSFELPLDYASTPAEMAAKVEGYYRRWKDDSSAELFARTAMTSVARFDSNAVLPRYERMLTEVLENGGS